MSTTSAGVWRGIGVVFVFAAIGMLLVFVPHNKLTPIAGCAAAAAFLLFAAARFYLQRLRVLRESESAPEVVRILQRREDFIASLGVGIGFVGVCAFLLMLALLTPDN